MRYATHLRIYVIIIIIIKCHSLRRACLQPATNTQSSKPRPPTTNAKSKGKLQNKIKHCFRSMAFNCCSAWLGRSGGSKGVPCLQHSYTSTSRTVRGRTCASRSESPFMIIIFSSYIIPCVHPPVSTQVHIHTCRSHKIEYCP